MRERNKKEGTKDQLIDKNIMMQERKGKKKHDIMEKQMERRMYVWQEPEREVKSERNMKE